MRRSHGENSNIDLEVSSRQRLCNFRTDMRIGTQGCQQSRLGSQLGKQVACIAAGGLPACSRKLRIQLQEMNGSEPASGHLFRSSLGANRYQRAPRGPGNSRGYRTTSALKSARRRLESASRRNSISSVIEIALDRQAKQARRYLSATTKVPICCPKQQPVSRWPKQDLAAAQLLDLHEVAAFPVAQAASSLAAPCHKHCDQPASEGPCSRG